MDAFAADFAHALRSLRKHPLLPLVAAASVALGVGVATAVFSVANALLVRPLPGIAEPARIVEVGRNDDGRGFDTFSYPDFYDLRREGGTFATLSIFHFQSASVNAGGNGRRLMGLMTSANYFQTLGVRPALGRFFVAGEDSIPGLQAVVVIGHRLWREMFNGDSSALGRTLVLSRVPFQIVGVAPDGFFGHVVAARPDFYAPITMQPAITHEDADRFTRRSSTSALVIGRLAPGVTVRRADAAVQATMRRLAREYPATNATRGARVMPLGPVPGVGRTGVAAFTAALTAVVALILLTVCANVAGMLLARAGLRQKEIAMRLVLGSSRGRIVRQVVLEALLIFAVGGAGGLLIAQWGTAALSAIPIPAPVEIGLDLRPDLTVLAVGLGVALVTGLTFGLLPALQVSNPALASVVKEASGTGTRRGGRLRRAFVVVQVAGSITLLACAGLFLRALQHAATAPIGFSSDGVCMTTVNLALEGYTEADGRAYHDRLLGRLRAIPGVTRAALAIDLPLDVSASGIAVVPAERAGTRDSLAFTDFNVVSDGYFETLGIGMAAGRTFAPQDRRGTTSVAIVDSTFAAQTWPGEDPLGKRLHTMNDSVQFTVVGVANPVPNQQVNEETRPMVYLPIAQRYFASTEIIVRGAAGMSVAAAIRPAILELDPAVSHTPVVLLGDYVSIAILPQRASAAMIAGLGLLALFLCALGVYGLMAHDVSRRTREFGVRVAVGAGPRDVAALVYRGAARVAFPGALVGAVLATGLSFALRGFLLGLGPLDPVALGAPVVVMVLVLGAACATPARRAMRVEPMAALREE